MDEHAPSDEVNPEDMEYSSAFIEFLDRDSGNLKRVMAYPIVKIQLNRFTGKEVVVQRTFTAQRGQWTEEQ